MPWISSPVCSPWTIRIRLRVPLSAPRSTAGAAKRILSGPQCRCSTFTSTGPAGGYPPRSVPDSRPRRANFGFSSVGHATLPIDLKRQHVARRGNIEAAAGPRLRLEPAGDNRATALRVLLLPDPWQDFRHRAAGWHASPRLRRGRPEGAAHRSRTRDIRGLVLGFQGRWCQSDVGARECGYGQTLAATELAAKGAQTTCGSLCRGTTIDKVTTDFPLRPGSPSPILQSLLHHSPRVDRARPGRAAHPALAGTVAHLFGPPA